MSQEIKSQPATTASQSQAMVSKKKLKTAKEEADGLPVGKEAPEEKVKTIEGYLDKTTNVRGKLQEMGAKIASFGNNILPLVSKAMLILFNVCTLFGLP